MTLAERSAGSVPSMFVCREIRGGRLLAGIILFLGIVAFPVPARADILPEPELVPWGVVDRIPAQQRNDNLLIKDMIVSADRVYVGGYFLNVQEGRNGQRISQQFLAAFDRATGEWDSGFRPVVEGPVKELLLSPDGSRLFVAGDFDSINGDTGVSGLAALDPATGAVQQDFKVDVEWEYQQQTLTVDALATDGTFLYFGGRFSRVSTTNQSRAFRNRIARVRLNDATLDGFAPQARGGFVAAMAIDPSINRLYVGGSFDSINGVTDTPEFAAIDTQTAQLISGVQQGIRISNSIERYRDFHYPYDIEVFPGHVAWAGDQHMEVMRTNDLQSVFSGFVRNRDCDSPGAAGDVQALEYIDGALYLGGHFREDAGCNIRDLIDRWIPGSNDFDGGFDVTFGVSSPAIWALETDPVNGDMWAAGNFVVADGTPANSIIRFPSTVTADDVRPSVPGRVDLVNVTDNTVSIEWAAATDNVGVAGYQIFRSEQAGVVGPQIATSPTPSFTDTGLASGVTYYYTVKAFDAAGNVGYRTGLRAGMTTTTVDTQRPSPPSSAPVISSAGNDVQITWGAASDNVGVTGYRIYRSTGGAGFTQVATSSTTTYLDTGLAAGTYSYYIRAFDQAGNVGFRTGIRSVEVTGGVIDTQRPSAPTRFRWTSFDSNSVNLSWNAAVDNVGVTSYEIFDDATRTVIGTTSGTSLTITGLNGSTSYRFFIRAIDGAGNSSFRSNFATFTTR